MSNIQGNVVIITGASSGIGEATEKEPDQMEELANYALKEFGQIDVLVNNAGLMPNSFKRRNLGIIYSKAAVC
ncbi:NADP-dependent 3-hydroxy acid dehydrogenase YdfG [Paenibacillus forsythiae]|uniref:NADP-dependent 3-hydroxy acid dehydrogenase YdfG n=1 Tax=Paenibacillus forsythiae TaxID=365616 RepID=A0ABU3H6A1_9BACL|nr:NADP-dependent 3-hydroxy acid dehydrogenase YdfG [Paenibacillus forsythiae]